jgi:hypothetical protein
LTGKAPYKSGANLNFGDEPRHDIVPTLDMWAAMNKSAINQHARPACGGDEQFGLAVNLVTVRMVLADPCSE